MIVLNFPCAANTLRGQLKHTWLENQIFPYNSDDIVSLWKEREWTETIDSIFPRRLQQTFELAEGLKDGFSPAQLVDKLTPLNNLSGKPRERLKKVIHDAYLVASKIELLEASLQECSLQLQKELNELQTIWKMPPSSENEIILRSCWENIRVKGKILHAVLEKLPRGVILP